MPPSPRAETGLPLSQSIFENANKTGTDVSAQELESYSQQFATFYETRLALATDQTFRQFTYRTTPWNRTPILLQVIRLNTDASVSGNFIKVGAIRPKLKS